MCELYLFKLQSGQSHRFQFLKINLIFCSKMIPISILWIRKKTWLLHYIYLCCSYIATQYSWCIIYCALIKHFDFLHRVTFHAKILFLSLWLESTEKTKTCLEPDWFGNAEASKGDENHFPGNGGAPSIKYLFWSEDRLLGLGSNTLGTLFPFV